MRNLKRVLTLVMAVAMMMSLLVVGAGAAFPDQDKIENTDAVNMNVALGIIKGRDTGNFDPAGNVTRAEMAKMICVMLNGGNEPTLGTKATASFKDTKGHWAEAYIEYCTSLGIVAGMGDGTFAPNANVTGTQAAKMLLVALGYDAAFEGFNGASWSVKINVAANQKVLYDEIAIDPNAPLNRDNAAQMVWNALNAVEVKYTYSLTTVNGQLQNVQVREDKAATATLLAGKFKTLDTATTDGVMDSFSYNTTKKEYTYTITGSTLGTFTTKDDFTNLFGQNVVVVAKSRTSVYGMYADGSSVIAAGYNGDIGTISTADKTVKIDGTAYKVENVNIPVIYYKTGTSAGNLSAITATAPYSLKLIDDNDNEKADKMVVVPFTVAEVTYVGADSITMDKGLGNIDKDDLNLYAGVAKNDVIIYTAGTYTYNGDPTVEKATIDNAKITGIKGSEYKINNTWMTNASGETLAVNDTIDYVAFGGVVYYADVTAGDSVSRDVALVINAGAKTGLSGGNEAKVIFTDGTKKIVDTDTNLYTALIGKLVTYKVNSDNEYTLTALSSTNKAGFDGVGTTAGYSDKKIGGYELADDAVVFGFVGAEETAHASNNAKVYTGKEMKNAYGAATFGTAYGTAHASAWEKVNGFQYAKVAAVKHTAAPIITTGSNYAYLTDDAYETYEGGKTYTNFTLWTANGEVKAKSEVSLNSDFVAGIVVTYDNDGEDIKNVTVAGITTGAVKGWDGNKKIQINSLVSEVNSDTTVLYVNSDKETGINGGAISLADEPTSGNFVNNVRYIGNSTELDLLVVDVNNKMEAASVVTVGAAAANTNALLAALFNTYDKVVVSDAYVNADAITIPAGKTLQLNSTLNATAATVNVNGTLTVFGAVTAPANISIAATGSVTLDTAATAATYEAIAKAAGAKLTVKASTDTAASATTWYTAKGTPDTDGAAGTTNGTAATAVIAGATVPAGTYTYGTLGYTGADGVVAPNVTGWFK